MAKFKTSPVSIEMTDGQGDRFTVKLKPGTTEAQARQIKDDLVKGGAQRVGSVTHFE